VFAPTVTVNIEDIERLVLDVRTGRVPAQKIEEHPLSPSFHPAAI
jgi:hypothetical protein